MEFSDSPENKYINAVVKKYGTDPKKMVVFYTVPDGNGNIVLEFNGTTDENGNRVFVGKAWMNEDGLNEIRIFIYRNSAWKQAGTLEYTVEVGHIVKPAFIAYLHDRHGAVGKQA